MIIQELKDKYDIKTIYFSYYMDYRYLFSQTDKDPEYLTLDALAGIKHWDIVFALGPAGTITTQVIEFKTKQGLDRYIRDKIIIFDYSK